MRSESVSLVTTIVRRAARYGYRALIVLVLIGALLVPSPEAMAQRKKKKEEEVGEATKAYVLPYLIVIMLVGVGMMTVCRPGRRKDRPDDKRKDDD